MMRTGERGRVQPLAAVVVALAVALAVAACAGGAPTATPSPAPAPASTVTAAQTATVTPQAPTPTATPLAPPTAAPSATPPTPPEPTATPTPTPLPPSPSPTPTAKTPISTEIPPSSTPPPDPTATPTGPLVTIGGVGFEAEVARTGAEQARGLSGRAELPTQSGMLFPQSRDVIASFWMRGMLIPLDFVWIGADCRVADLTENVPPPDDPEQRTGLPIYSPSEPVRYIFEINAGEVAALGIEIGDEVRFGGLDLEEQCAA